ncbi:hypothetical protein M5K25_023293 [Dendrobium thyrsiflorum]|uniref:Protein PHLOEM PROTEIN 2-LIKE A9-like n=1 Tax=Dendrobium thyrsiflorum TaxID=117978 RepID=A0ABD0U7X6_DENTH
MSSHYKGDKSNNVVIHDKPRALDITWGGDERYWKFPSSDNSSPVELLQVSWLQVNGKAKLSYFVPEKEYAVKFKVELKPDNFGWADPVYLMVATDGRQRTWKKADLSTKIAGKEFDVPIDKLLTFKVPKDTNGKMVEFGMYEIWKGRWKGGLVINEVLIEPASS